jgi:hypothetical protein
VSLDIDSAVKLGLAQLSGQHIIADASLLPLAAASVEAVASEPPYFEGASDAVARSIGEVARVLHPGKRAAYLVASHQADAVREAGHRAALTLELEERVLRKGTHVVCFCWMR